MYRETNPPVNMNAGIERPITVLIVDNDPIFRLGLVMALEREGDLEVVADGDSETVRRETLADSPGLILLDPYLGNAPDWSIGQLLRERYPHSPIVLFSLPLDTEEQLKARGAGCRGYIRKGTPSGEAIAILRRVVREDEVYWSPAAGLVVLPGLPPTHWLIRLGEAGLSRVEEELRALEGISRRPGLSVLDRLYWRGRRRELLASFWLVRKLIPVETGPRALSPPAVPVAPPAIAETSLLARSRPFGVSLVFEDTLAEIRSSPRNSTTTPFETDVLEESRKRELLYLVLDRTRKASDESRFLGVTRDELAPRVTFLVREIWEEATSDFIALHFPGSGESDRLIREEREPVQENILEKIPFTLDLFTFLVYEEGVRRDQQKSRPLASETIEWVEILLQNFVHGIANAVMASFLNHFSDSERAWEELFRPEYRSSRAIARARNELSWKYRREKYWDEPKWIFESKYRLFRYRGGAIVPVYLHAPRQEELNRLTGIRWWVSIALETRDALSPRLRALFAVVGKGAVYVLVQVIGRGLGLVVRGVLQGIGNTWQEVRGKK